MSIGAPVTTGVSAFIEGLATLGIHAELRGPLIVFQVEALSGPHAGRSIETGVATDELSGWPTTPPHWVHFPDEVKLEAPQQSELAEWSKYSRPHPGRLDASGNPARDWVAHIRELLGRAG